MHSFQKKVARFEPTRAIEIVDINKAFDWETQLL